MTAPTFQPSPPQDETLTSYDELHFVTYLRLLDAESEGADWREVVKIVFELDADAEPERAKIVHDSHLARAHWLSRSGYRHLLAQK